MVVMIHFRSFFSLKFKKNKDNLFMKLHKTQKPSNILFTIMPQQFKYKVRLHCINCKQSFVLAKHAQLIVYDLRLT